MSRTDPDSKSATDRDASPKAAELLSAFGMLMFGMRQWMRANLPTDGGMTVPRATLLLALANKQGRVSMSELGEMAGLSPRSMTVLADGLEKEGMIERVAHPADRRVHLLGITEAGARLARQQLGPAQEAMANLFHDLRADEKDELLRLVTGLIQSLKQRGIEVPASRHW